MYVATVVQDMRFFVLRFEMSSSRKAVQLNNCASAPLREAKIETGDQ